MAVVSSALADVDGCLHIQADLIQAAPKIECTGDRLAGLPEHGDKPEIVEVDRLTVGSMGCWPGTRQWSSVRLGWWRRVFHLSRHRSKLDLAMRLWPLFQGPFF